MHNGAPFLALLLLGLSGCETHGEGIVRETPKAESHPTDVTCVGENSGFQYPTGPFKAPTSFRVVFHENSDIEIQGPNGSHKLCRPGAECAFNDSPDHFSFSMNKVPNTLKYNESMSINFIDGVITSGGGGVDGNWSFSGVCKP